MDFEARANQIYEELAPTAVRDAITKTMRVTSMNQGQLADCLGVSSSQITAWKSAEYFPQPWVAHKLNHLTDGAVSRAEVLPHVFLDPSSTRAGRSLEQGEVVDAEDA